MYVIDRDKIWPFEMQGLEMGYDKKKLINFGPNCQYLQIKAMKGLITHTVSRWIKNLKRKPNAYKTLYFLIGSR
jgi:hypothetical protein